MQKGDRLQFTCEACEEPILFSVLNSSSLEKVVECAHCSKKYAFDKAFLLHLNKFESLCRQIHESQEILGHSAIAIDVGEHHVKVPFNILLTRLSSTIELDMNGKKRTISFRVEPLHDIRPLA